MEASALPVPESGRRGIGGSLLRLRSDEQLIAAFRAGNEEAFATIHDRYRQRLFAYVRQMLPTGQRAEAEDVLQDVFVRAYGALRANDRPIALRAWLYRIAHNRCIDHLRRPTPPADEIYEVSRTPLQDPIETAQRRDDLRRLVEDVGRLPEQQRSALLMREMDGMSYTDIAEALGVTVAAVKSLLVRARSGLVEEIMARDTDCAEIRADLLDAYDRGVKSSGRAKRHLRECQGCREYKVALRSMQRSFAMLSPVVGFAPLAMAAKALGFGGSAGGGAAAGAGLATGGKVCAVICTAALATGGAVEIKHWAKDDTAPKVHRFAPAPVATHAPVVTHTARQTAPAYVPPAATATATSFATAAPTAAAGTTGPSGVVGAAPSVTPAPVVETPTPTPEASATDAAATATP